MIAGTAAAGSGGSPRRSAREVLHPSRIRYSDTVARELLDRVGTTDRRRLLDTLMHRYPLVYGLREEVVERVEALATRQRSRPPQAPRTTGAPRPTCETCGDPIPYAGRGRQPRYHKAAAWRPVRRA